MTPYVYLLYGLRAVFVSPVSRLKWLFSYASRNPSRGEVGTRGCFTHITLCRIYSYLWTVEDFNRAWTGKLAHKLDLKLYQIHPILYTYIFEHDRYIELSDGSFFIFKKERNR